MEYIGFNFWVIMEVKIELKMQSTAQPWCLMLCQIHGASKDKIHSNILMTHLIKLRTLQQKELIIYVLNKLAFSNPHTFIVDQIFGRDSTKQEKDYNFLLIYLDKRFGELVNINSLNLWVGMFHIFAETIWLK